jgi:monoamine oxidase
MPEVVDAVIVGGGCATVDLGGQWIGPGQDHIAELAAETGVDTFPQWTAGDDLAEYPTAVAWLNEAAAGNSARPPVAG